MLATVFVAVTGSPDDLRKADTLLADFLQNHYLWVRTTSLGRVVFELFPMSDPMKAMG